MLKAIPTEDHAVNNSTVIESRRSGGRYFSVRFKFLRGGVVDGEGVAVKYA